MAMTFAERLGSLGDPAAAFDDEGNVVYCNPALRRLLGYGVDEDLSTLHLSDFYPEREYERVLEEAYPKTAGEEAWNGRLTMRTKTGRILETEHLVEAHHTSEGSLTHVTIRARAVGSVV